MKIKALNLRVVLALTSLTAMVTAHAAPEYLPNVGQTFPNRVQIVKGWLDKTGATQEKVYDIAWAGQSEKTRKPGKNGKLPPVGNTVNVAEASYSNSIGAPTLEAYWKDPAFKPEEKAFYYVRVLEIPTPNWTVYDAKVFGTVPSKEAPTSLQQRAYTSPMWYSPS